MNPMPDERDEAVIGPEIVVSGRFTSGGTTALTEDEVVAVQNYTEASWIGINRALRSPDEFAKAPEWAKESVNGDVALLDAAIAKQPGLPEQVLYRGVNIPQPIYPGDVVTDPGYMSTTADKDLAQSFRTGEFMGEPNKGGALLEIHVPDGYSGLNVDALVKGASGEQQEVILPRGQEFDVVSHTGSLIVVEPHHV